MYYHGTECAPAHCQSCKSLITGKPTVVEIFEPHLDRFVEIRAIPRFDKNDRVVGLIHVVRDITEHRKLEEQLRQAQKIEAIGQLAGGVAHDFNNILTAILGDAYLLEMKMGADAPLRHYIEDIRASAEKAAQLTQGLLAFSRKQILNPKSLDVNAVVRKLHRLTARLIGEDIDYQTHLSAKELTVMADGGQMEQILINLITNARDAMPQGGTLTIGTRPAVIDAAFISAHGFGRAGDYALISVADSGEGMDDSTRNRIFEPFFTTKEVGKGTGLGLAIVYGIVKQHEGFILCESRRGKGSVFTLYFPLVAPKSGELQEMMALPEQGTECVLLAEDDAGVRNTMRKILEEFGYRVVAAADGADAVRKFEEHQGEIRLLLLDVVMPKKNGMEACKEIRKIDPGAKVLFLSGHPNEIIHKKGTLDESLNFLQKPSSPAALLAAVRRLLDGKVSS
jgi:signal transduction histidine kinase/ActR/RegA family two-component response regulator